MCNCEEVHEEKFVCDFCFTKAKCFSEIANLFNYEFDELTSQEEKQYITATRLIWFLDSVFQKESENGIISPLEQMKMESMLEAIHSKLFWIRIMNGGK